MIILIYYRLISKNTLTNLKKKSSSQGPMGHFQPYLTQLIHPWVKGMQVCSNEGPRPFSRGDNFEIVKYLEQLGHFPPNLAQSILVKGIQVCSNEETFSS